MAVSLREDARGSAFERLALVARHAWLALTVWITVTVTIRARTVGTAHHNDFSLPGTESNRPSLEDLAPPGRTLDDARGPRHDGPVRRRASRRGPGSPDEHGMALHSSELAHDSDHH